MEDVFNINIFWIQKMDTDVLIVFQNKKVFHKIFCIVKTLLIFSKYKYKRQKP